MQALSRSLKSPVLSERFGACACPCVLDIYQACDTYRCLFCDSHYKANWTHGSQRYPEPIMHSLRESELRTLIAGTLTGAWEAVPSKYQALVLYIHSGAPVQIGQKADPFPLREREYKVTLACLRMLHEVNIPLTLATKAAWWARDPKYTEVFMLHPDVPDAKRVPWHVRFSISSLDPRCATVEPGVPSPYERLEAMQILSSLGVSTTLWLRPFIPGLSDDWKELVEQAAQAGAKAVSVEYLSIPHGRDPERAARFGKLSEILGYDIAAMWKENADGSTLKASFKRDTLQAIRSYCHARGLKFTVSDRHNKDLSDCGNCCGAPASMGFLTSQIMWIIKKAMQNGKVSWTEIEPELDELFSIATVSEAGLSTGWDKKLKAKYGKLTLKEYLHALWNDPENPRGFWIPYGKILVPAGRDARGDAIYQFKGE